MPVACASLLPSNVAPKKPASHSKETGEGKRIPLRISTKVKQDAEGAIVNILAVGLQE